MCLLITVWAPYSPAKTSREYHVAISGSDTHGSGSVQNPWRTIGFAVSRIVGGDIVIIHEGSYREKCIRLPLAASGSEQYPTVIRAADDEEVIVYGVDNHDEHIYTMEVDRVSYVVIEGLKITGFSRTEKGGKGGTLYISGWKKPAVGIKILNCEFTNSGTKLGNSNPSVVVFNYTENCEIRNCKVYGSGKCDRTGIKIWSGTSRLLVQGNEVFNLLRKGIDNKHGGRDKYLIIMNNYVHDIGHMGIQLNGDKSLIESNVLYNCQLAIGVWRNEGSPGGSYSILNHNTLVNCGNGIVLGFGPVGQEGFRSCTVTNNIILNCSGEFPELSITPYQTTPFNFGHTIDYNCYFNDRYSGVIRDHKRKPFSLVQWQKLSGQDAHSVQQDPELLGKPNDFKDLCDFQVGEDFARSFKTSDGRVIGADISNMKKCESFPKIPANVRISNP